MVFGLCETYWVPLVRLKDIKTNSRLRAHIFILLRQITKKISFWQSFNANESSFMNILFSIISLLSIKDKSHRRPHFYRFSMQWKFILILIFLLFSLNFFFHQRGDFSISVKGADRVKHFKVHVGSEDSRFLIGQKKFDNLDDIVAHYKNHPIFTNETTRLFLTNPLPRSWHAVTL